ncbi:DHBP synthase RibB-like alpha/beta domain-containing protein [Sesbania bispinosa]|nr:DHBP synthase RibB-like alpha/beta domain-containing protein [Sesbania bispinosa]
MAFWISAHLRTTLWSLMPSSSSMRDEDPLEESEPYSNDGANGNQNLSSEIWENRWRHDREQVRRKGKGRVKG